MQYRKFIIFILVLCILGSIAYVYPEKSGRVVEDTDYEKEPAFVIRVIDGDTIESDLGDVRLLGINCPEKGEFLYEEAKIFLKEIENKSIDILRDGDGIDKYGRNLGYVFYENRLMNVEILERGLANTYMLEGLGYREKLEKAEDFASTNGIGLWKRSEEECARCIELIELDFIEEFFILRNNCNFDCNLKTWTVKDSGRNVVKLEKIQSNQEMRFNSKSNIWNNDGDNFFLRDNKGKLVIFYAYGN
jgi:micrococcal nuclease